MGEFLKSKKRYLKELVLELSTYFKYVSILGSEVHQKTINANKFSTSISEGGLDECGFVVKMHNGKAFYEYSFDVTDVPASQLAETIIEKTKLSSELEKVTIECPLPKDEPMVKNFVRENDYSEFSEEYLLGYCKDLVREIASKDEHVANASAMVSSITVDKIFVTKNRELYQNYGWVNGRVVCVYSNGKMVRARDGAYSTMMKDVIKKLPTLVDNVVDKARHLVNAKPIEPGIYDIITDPSITGLIAHEAFGHGVEMDQFVKDRALAKLFMNQYVASPISNMRDGAASTLSVASYFFDDDGVLAHDTQIIKDGILVSGISDLTSALQLGTEPTGNGRRESTKHKAYTRMTNTFFDNGTDSLEDMIKSIKHGYMLFETNNGMEDPKNWQIQCTAEYGIEIVDGKLTDNYVSPVVMSGSVPELLKSISMVSNNQVVAGEGSCGKGYKEWVRVSDGGPSLKARVKLS